MLEKQREWILTFTQHLRIQLALSAVAAAQLEVNGPFRYIPQAMCRAEWILQQIEMGRVEEGGWALAVGSMYRYAMSSKIRAVNEQKERRMI